MWYFDDSAPDRLLLFFFFQAEDGIRDLTVTGVQTRALPISRRGGASGRGRSVRAAGGDRGPALPGAAGRSGGRRVGEEGRSRGAADHLKKKKDAKFVGQNGGQ